MSKRLYVGNLSFQTTEQELQDLFQEVGQVDSCNLITDKVTGKSRGFGFVEMAVDEDGQKAIDEFDGKEVDGRTLKVNEARPRQERAPRRSFNRGPR
ncbi:MAG: RNA recognition motif domain-containing protein [Verrucomicrobiota bacterium]